MIGVVVVGPRIESSAKRGRATRKSKHHRGDISYLETGSEPISVLDPREWTSGVLESSGLVTELGGTDATRLLPFPYRT
jgi:hypothetical protein